MRFRRLLRSLSFVIVLLVTQFLLTPVELSAQTVAWARFFGLPRTSGNSVAVSSGGAVYVAGVLSNGPGSGWDDAIVRKYDIAGTELWTRQFGTVNVDGIMGADGAMGIAIDPSDDSAYAIGYVNGALPGQTPFGKTDAFLRKYSSSGNELWTRQFGTALDDYGWSVAVDTVGSIFVAGPLQASSGNFESFLRKFDSSGNELWSRQFGPGPARRIAVDSAGNVYVPGSYSAGAPGGSDVFLSKFDTSGTQLWVRQFGSSNSDVAHAVATDTNGVYFVGSLNSVGHVRKYDSSGVLAWSHDITGVSEARGVATDGLGGLYVVGNGWLVGSPGSGRGFFVRKYDGSGNEIGTTQISGAETFTAVAVALASTGTLFATGNAFGGQGILESGYVASMAMGGLAGGPEISVLEGTTSLNDGGSLSFGTTDVSTPVSRTFTVRNDGTSPLTLQTPITVPSGFTVTSSFDSISLAPNQTTNFTVRMDATSVGSPSGTLQFATNDADESPFNFMVSGTVNPSADLRVSIADNPDPATPGSDVTLAVTVANSGPSPATGVTLTTTLPPGPRFVAATPSQGTCTGTATVTCDLGSVPSSASATVMIVTKPTAAAVYTTSATVTATEADPVSTNNAVTETTTVAPPSSLARLTVALEGQGSATSSAAGITCRPDCVTFLNPGTQVALSAAPDTGWVFDHWGGACTGTAPVCMVTVNTDTMVRAAFRRQR